MKLNKKFMALTLTAMLSFSTVIIGKYTAYAEVGQEDLTSIINEMKNNDISCISEAELKYQDLEILNKNERYKDVTNPNSYRLITNSANDMLALVDKYGEPHGISYYESSRYDNQYERITFLYVSLNKYVKSNYIICESYKESNGKLTLQDKGAWNVSGKDKIVLNAKLDRSLYNQSHLYFKFGVSDKLTGSYEDFELVKIKNPFYENTTKPEATMKDISGHWAEATIKDFISKGYINGYADNTFRPNNSITRAEFVTIVNNYFGLTKSSGKVFNDTKTHWAKSAIDIAVTNGVCNGISTTEFKPNDPITREQASVMISNYKKLSDKDHDKINNYSDKNQVSSWAKDGVEGMIKKGYMSGYSDNTFRPKNHITRAEAVVTLSRVK